MRKTNHPGVILRHFPPVAGLDKLLPDKRSAIALIQHVIYLRWADDAGIMPLPDVPCQRAQRLGLAGLQRGNVPAGRNHGYSFGSPGGRVLKRLCSQKYCSGISRTRSSMKAFMRRVSASTSALG